MSILHKNFKLEWTGSWKLTSTYVAIHCSKALSLRIVCQPLKIIFIKGPVFELHIKFTAFTTHLPLKVQDSFKVLSLACNVLWKLQVLIKTWRRFCRTSFFQRKMFDKLVPGHIWLCALVFKRVLHGKICAKFSMNRVLSKCEFIDVVAFANI